MNYQFEEEVSSGGDQLASNKIDTYTIEGRLSGLPFLIQEAITTHSNR